MILGDDAAAATGGTGGHRVPGSAPEPPAMGAGGGATHLDRGGDTGCGVLEPDAEVGLDVGAPRRAASGPRSRSRRGRRGPRTHPAGRTGPRPDLLSSLETAAPTPVSGEATGLDHPPHLVVLLALLDVGQGGVGLGDLLELLLGLGVPRIGVGMMGLCQLAVCLLDLLGAGRFLDTEDLIEVLVDPVPVHCRASRTTIAGRKTRLPKPVPTSQLLGDHEVGASRRGADRLVDLGVEGLADRREHLQALLFQGLEQLLPGVDHPGKEEPLPVGGGLGIERGVEGVEDGQELADHPLGGTVEDHCLFPCRPLPVVVEVRGDPAQVVEIGACLLPGLDQLFDEQRVRLVLSSGSSMPSVAGSMAPIGSSISPSTMSLSNPLICVSAYLRIGD